MATYEGWSNYETWLVNLTLDNDEPLYKAVLDLAKRYRSASVLAAQIQKFVEGRPEFGFRSARAGTMAETILESFLDDVDWEEIAKSKL